MTLFIIILLIVLGVVLLLLEFFVIPGITVAAIGGIVMIGGGIYLSYHHYGTQMGHITSLVTAVFCILVLVLALKSKTWNRIMLSTNIEAKVEKEEADHVQPGDQGVCVSRLAPMGKIKVNSEIMEAKSIGVYIEEKTQVEVVGVVDKIVIVKPI